jgi:adenylate cyclase
MKLVAKLNGQTLGEFDLTGKESFLLGRCAEADVCVTDEPCMSRRHAVLRVLEGKVDVEKVESAANPLVYKGVRADRFRMAPGGVFVIGATTFQCVGEPGADASDEPAPQFQYTMQVEEMRRHGGAEDRLRLLDLMELPVVLRSHSRPEFFLYACGSMMRATGAAWTQVLTHEKGALKVLAEDAALDRGQDRRVSKRLLDAAIVEAPKPVAYCWSGAAGAVGAMDMTAYEGIDWAVCCAMPVPGEAPILFYVAGSNASPVAGPETVAACDMTLKNTSRLVGLVADMIGRAMSMDKLETWKYRLGQFFSEKVVEEILESDAPNALEPRITEATVMFFDIRGFSKRTEENFSLRDEENLERILNFARDRRVVLNEVSGCVIENNGIIISYAGDGLLACWNVPKPIENHEEKGCLTAIEMIERISMIPGGWRCGIGLASGQLVAGSLGSDQKEQYDILGAVVNQCSRIEGITKVVGVSALVTSAVANGVSSDRVMARRVARFRPAGMEETVDLYTIDRTPEDAGVRSAMEKRFAIHGEGLALFEEGAWDEAFNRLTAIAAEDPAAKYLVSRAVTEKPDDWDGAIRLTSK